jgi:hypothetical protein
MCRDVLGCVGICRNVLGCVGMCREANVVACDVYRPCLTQAVPGPVLEPVTLWRRSSVPRH